ncbi:restriction endonuclease subunit S [Actinoplanes sp. NPDC049316]|uniref:restriction endonuclease subunit S n=1 Tax=Actinoplanes sp. NPDC049316 TaxID=3154727 RepID=UPI00342B587A
MNGLSKLPAGWRWSTVQDVGRLDLGRQRHPDWHTGPEMRPYLRVANVFEDRIDTSDVKEMDFSGVFERYKLKPGDVLLNEGQSPEFLGRPAIYRGVPENVAFTNTLIRFRAGPEVTPEWALIVFRRHMHARRFVRESRITTNIAHLSAARLKTVEFPVPPLGEQGRIVAIVEDYLSRLGAANRLVAISKKKAVALRRSALDSVINRAGRSTILLRHLIDRIEAGKSFGGSSGPASADQWGIIKVSAMTWGEFRPGENKTVADESVDPRYEIRPGDLLVSRANTSDYVGASVLVGDVRRRLLLSDKSLRLVPRSHVDPAWLWFALSSPRSRSQISAMATGTKESMRNISQANLLAVEVPDISIEEQRADASSLFTHFDNLARLNDALDSVNPKYAALRRSLLDAAYSGRLTGRASDEEMVEELSGV